MRSVGMDREAESTDTGVPSPLFPGPTSSVPGRSRFIIAFHVSNQYLNLAPEIAQLAIASNMHSRLVESAGDDLMGSYRSTWVLLSNSPEFFNLSQIASLSTETPTTPRLRPWTDEYSSLLRIVQLTKH